MKRFFVASLAALAAAAMATATPAAAPPTFRMPIVHHFRGCHVWVKNEVRGASTSIKVKPGTRLAMRISDPMDFEFRQLAGPRLELGARRSTSGTVRTIVFKKPGRYVLSAKNLQSSQELSLQTLGPDNLLRLIVVVT